MNVHQSTPPPPPSRHIEDLPNPHATVYQESHGPYIPMQAPYPHPPRPTPIYRDPRNIFGPPLVALNHGPTSKLAPPVHTPRLSLSLYPYGSPRGYTDSPLTPRDLHLDHPHHTQHNHPSNVKHHHHYQTTITVYHHHKHHFLHPQHLEIPNKSHWAWACFFKQKVKVSIRAWEHAPRMRLHHISKLLSKFVGENDPIHHMERFEQVCETLGEIDDLNKVLAFGLSLEGKAGHWFQSLSPTKKIN